MTGRKLNLVLPSSVDSSFNLAGREKFSSDREDPRRIRNPKSGRIRFKLGLKRQEIRLCCCDKARREKVELCYFIVVFGERERVSGKLTGAVQTERVTLFLSSRGPSHMAREVTSSLSLPSRERVFISLISIRKIHS